MTLYHFIAIIQTQFNKTVRCVRSNHGSELVFKEVQDLLNGNRTFN